MNRPLAWKGSKKVSYLNRWPGYHLRKHQRRAAEKGRKFRIWVRRELRTHRSLQFQLDETSRRGRYWVTLTQEQRSWRRIPTIISKRA